MGRLCSVQTDCRSRMFQRNHLLDFENFLKKCPTGKDPPIEGISRPAGREQLADCGSSSVITFWTLSKFQNISKSAVGRDAHRLSTYASKRYRRLRIFQRNHLLDFVKISKYFKVRSGKRRAHEGLSTGRSRTIRRLRIFQRNHLLDFVKISKYFKVRSGKRRTHEGLSTGRSRTTRRLRIFQRNHLLDFVKISKYFKVRSGKRFIVGRDSPIGVLFLCSVQTDLPIADVPA